MRDTQAVINSMLCRPTGTAVASHMKKVLWRRAVLLGQ